MSIGSGRHSAIAVQLKRLDRLFSYERMYTQPYDNNLISNNKAKGMSDTNSQSMDFIEVYDNVLSDEQCQQLIQRFESDQRKHEGRTGNGVDKKKKNSIDLTISDHEDWQETVQQIQINLFEPLCEYMRKYHFLVIGALSPTVQNDQQQAVTLNHENFASLGPPVVPQLVNYMYRAGRLNMQKYLAGKGNYNHWHSEVFPQSGSVEPLHRVLLYQFYLNDVTEGGHTTFYYQNRQVQPKRGRLIIAPAGFTHTHRGEIPVSGDKYVMTSWVMFKPAEALYAQAS